MTTKVRFNTLLWWPTREPEPGTEDQEHSKQDFWEVNAIMEGDSATYSGPFQLGEEDGLDASSTPEQVAQVLKKLHNGAEDDEWIVI